MDVSLGDFVIVDTVVDAAAAAAVGVEVVAVAVVAWLPGPQCETPTPEVLVLTRLSARKVQRSLENDVLNDVSAFLRTDHGQKADGKSLAWGVQGVEAMKWLRLIEDWEKSNRRREADDRWE